MFNRFNTVQEAREAGFNVVTDFHNYLLQNSHAINNFTRIVDNTDHTYISVNAVSDKYYPKFQTLFHTGNKIFIEDINEQFVEVVAITRLSKYFKTEGSDFLVEMNQVKNNLDLTLIRDSTLAC